jgi:hypothetical protein
MQAAGDNALRFYNQSLNDLSGRGAGMTSVSSLWFPDKAKIETEPEEDEMDDGATTADLRCFDKTSPQQRHRDIGKIEIEHNAR